MGSFVGNHCGSLGSRESTERGLELVPHVCHGNHRLGRLVERLQIGVDFSCSLSTLYQPLLYTNHVSYGKEGEGGEGGEGREVLTFVILCTRCVLSCSKALILRQERVDMKE